MIEIIDVHKSFGRLEILRGINMEVEKNKVHSILGASGSGKSTLLQCINGLESIQQGRISVDGIDVGDKATNLNALRTKIGIVFQQFNVFPHLTTLENITLALKVVMKKTTKEAKEIAVLQLERIGLGDKVDVYPSKLSGGQQQRLAIARALAMSPSYMLFDEITSALDPMLVGEVLDALRGLKENGMTMMIVTHEIRFAKEVSDTVSFLHKGKVIESGPPGDIIDNPREVETIKFLERSLN
ncbi:MAG: amino acid ABC transporter ATP-binding protein [Gammaproteobacteria bacterium]|nr:amino acid ABC transporter ATP-binding protein [Gammaproteobacteria bacterium]MDH3450283.1 amino acid ABC transporter ATP-binding protein [Gammaproteobacteria bacterium]